MNCFYSNKIFVCVCLSAVFREVAVRSVAKTMHTLDPDSDRRRLERLMRAVESIFERDDGMSVLRLFLLSYFYFCSPAEWETSFNSCSDVRFHASI